MLFPMIRHRLTGVHGNSVHGAIKLSKFAIITHPTITTNPPRLPFSALYSPFHFCLFTLSFKLRLNCFYASFALAIE